jgi:peptidyl-prolyl cis-trans isomerase D
MLSFFRRWLNSWLSLALLGLVLIAFVVTGVVTKEMSSGGGASGDVIAKVGGEAVGSDEIARRAQNALEAARQQNPGLDMAGFVNAGGLDQVVTQYIDDRTLDIWGRNHRVGASDRLIDGEIASIPAFHGPAGQFDPTLMRGLLAQRHVSENDLRQDVASGAIRRQLLLPVAAAAFAPGGLVVPYASLLLEGREGMVGVVPFAAIPPGPLPTEADIAAWYKQNIARFTIPERRVLRYAIFGKDDVKPATPTEDEIALFYKQNTAAYGARETRTLAQVILPDRAAADALAAKIKAGATFDAAAREAGFQPQDTKVGDVSAADYAAKASRAVADAAFAAPRGGVAGPVKADLGWYVVKVDDVKRIVQRPLAAVHDEIAKALVAQKNDEALANMVTAVEDAISSGSSFADVAKSEKLTVVTTPAILPNGMAPDQPDYHAPPESTVLLKSAFQASPDDQPTVETIGAGQRYALLGVAKVVQAAPAPLANVHDAVAHDIVAHRASDRAKALAEAIQAKVKSGMAMDKALAGAGVPLPPAQKAAAHQMDLARTDQPAPSALTLLFAMKLGDTKLIPSDRKDAWFIVHLDKIEPGNAATRPDLVSSMHDQFANMLGQEYAEQFTSAIAKEIGVTRYPQAIARLKARLSGASAGQ